MTPPEFYELFGLIRRASRWQRTHDTICAGKHRFDSHEAALRTMRRDLQKVARPYRCRDCGGWHIGALEHIRKARLYREGKR